METIEHSVKMLALENDKCLFEEWYKGIKDTPNRAVSVRAQKFWQEYEHETERFQRDFRG